MDDHRGRSHVLELRAYIGAVDVLEQRRRGRGIAGLPLGSGEPPPLCAPFVTEEDIREHP
jgi:hypothetical protein